MKIDAKIERVGEIAVDGGTFIILDPCYRESLIGCDDIEEIKRVVETWYGYMASWGDGNYPIYEVQDDASGDVIGLLILQEGYDDRT